MKREPRRLGPMPEPEKEKAATPSGVPGAPPVQPGAPAVSRWKKFSENKFGKSVMDFFLTAPFTYIYLKYTPTYLQSYIGGGISLPVCTVIAALLFLPVIGVIYYLWGSHWPMGQRKKGFALVALIILAVTTTQIICNLPEKRGLSFELKQGEDLQTSVSIPDRTTVKFNSNRGFYVVERYATLDDGTEKLTKIKMPVGNSTRYFTWGGTVRIEGIYDETKVVISF